jgi:hypothetical protein
MAPEYDLELDFKIGILIFLPIKNSHPLPFLIKPLRHF